MPSLGASSRGDITLTEVNRASVHLETPAIAVLTLNSPANKNAINLALTTELHALLDALEDDPHVRVLIIVSAVPGVFVAGGDIRQMRDLNLTEGVKFVYAGHKLMRRLERSELVTIAVVDGYALGGGTELAIACDFRVGSPRAVFGQPETSLGLLPGWGGTQRLPRIIGESRAKDLILTARRVDGTEAARIGLVDRVENDPTQAALDFASEIIANAPMAVRRAKRIITEGLNGSLDQGLVLEAESWLANLSSPDRVEGLTAFLEKRAPNFGGEPE